MPRILQKLTRKRARVCPGVRTSSIPQQPEKYSVTVLSSASEIENLSDRASHLLAHCETAATPKCFLAAIDENVWAPRVVIVRESDTIIGIVCAKERIFAGLPTGIVFADSTLYSMVIADPLHREAVILNAVQALIDRPGVRALRILIPQGGHECFALAGLSSSLTVSRTSVEHHSVLRLPSSYDLFLQGLGSRTRRNFRYYRRLNGAERTFVEAVPFIDFKAACSQLTEEGGIAVSSGAISRALNVLSAAKQPLLVGLKDVSGRYISILGGWYEPGRVIVFFQMNGDRKYPGASLSVVLRGHFLEMAIGQGINNVVFWAGAGGALGRYVEPIPTTALYFDKPTVLWQSLRRFIQWRRSILPTRFRDLAEWVVPSSGNLR